MQRITVELKITVSVALPVLSDRTATQYDWLLA